ncbi:thiamine pyrophosphate-dependent enzyme [Polaromonas sp. P1(28)-8]|nr:thiamine pyrophosphate-dependent enzyme [Polaromonas sp. P1(28)-8]
MKRDACFRILADLLPDDIVVSTYTSAFEFTAIRPHPLNYVSIGAMGLASSHGLGLALAMPERRIVVLDGDGSLLMNLGTLVTVASAAPRRFVHFVCRNGSYEANGGTPSRDGPRSTSRALRVRQAMRKHTPFPTSRRSASRRRRCWTRRDPFSSSSTWSPATPRRSRTTVTSTARKRAGFAAALRR